MPTSSKHTCTFIDLLLGNGIWFSISVPISVFAMLAVSGSAYSGEFKLIIGGEMDVCGAYAKNLNTFDNLPLSMVCDRRINEQCADFREPDWKELDPLANTEILRAMDDYLGWTRLTNFSEATWLQRIRRDKLEGKLFLQQAWFDINNDGKVDHIYKYSYGICNPTDRQDFSNPKGEVLLAWKDEDNAIETDISRFLRARRYHVFIYKNRTYLDTFTNGEIIVYTAVVHKALDGTWAELGADTCRYRYE